jgi:capsular polysaccharide export protein
MKKSGKLLRKKYNKKLVFIEDGFIHSFGIKKKNIPLSICYDNNGIYYNCNFRNDLNNFVKEKLSKNNISRAKKIIELWKKYSISKYNFPSFIEPPSYPYILLIDQTFGDLSIDYGEANDDSFKRMFEFAINNWPDHKIVIKTHPDVINYKKKGCIDLSKYNKNNIIVVGDIGQINRLIESSSAVCVVTSQVGFEALIYGKDVHVFGSPFYSGLGLTFDNNLNNKEVKKNITLEQLVFSSLVKYQICIDPRTKKKM